MGIMLSANWPDLLEKDIRKVYIDQYKPLPAMTPDLFNIMGSSSGYEKVTGVTPVPDHVEFTGKISTVERVLGYDRTHTFTEYAAQIQIQRKLAADDQTRTVNRFGKGLSTSANRSREKLAANVFNLAFTYEPSDLDGTELCASDHPSPKSGVSNQSNESTLSLSATNVETTRLAMYDFYDLDGETISVAPDSCLIPRDLEETGWEIINSKGKVDTADNNANFHQGKYNLVVWDRLTDANNWFMFELAGMKEYLCWYNREPIQMFQDKDSDTLIAKYLSYYRCGTGWDDWRFIYGQLVS